MTKRRDFLAGKRVIVVGFGRQGQALARWLPTLGAKVTVTDQRTADQIDFVRRDYPDADLILGEHPLRILRGADLICISGGVPLNIPFLEEAKERNIPFTNDAQLFLERCPAPVIGITGSAGKTTTTTLIGEILKRAGYTTWVGGNIGDVLLDVLDQITPEDRVVMELSSFQLELMTRSPQIALVLNVTPNHLDRHGTMENYMNAKANILHFQNPQDVAVLCKDDPGSRSFEGLVEGELAWFSQHEIVPDGAFKAGTRIMLAGAASYDYVPHILVNESEVPLLGKHNLWNVMAAATVAGTLGLATNRPGIPVEIIQESIRAFKPVPHRLETVRELDGVKYINDSIATAPERLLAALSSFQEPLVLLLGGADKDLPWTEAIFFALRKARHIILFGESGKKQVRDIVTKELERRRVAEDRFTSVDTLEEAVQKAYEIAGEGETVLLSPGGTSYDAYSDFAERGEHFRKLVSAL